ncbi:MAG TPA: hypothetical protein VIO86_11175 [Candidatus Dormibacteraeota bacterium]|jgi:hypothetical protein
MPTARRRLLALTTLLLLSACGGGSSTAAKPSPSPTPTPTPAPSPTFDLGALALAFAGSYAGTWTNTTFNSKGTVLSVIAFEPATQTVTANLTVGGNVFGGAAPPPETFSGKLGQLGALGFSGHSPTFGDFTVTTTGPTFVMKAQNVPNARVDHFEADGLLTGTAISGTYKVFFKDGTTADGVFSLAKS